MCEQNKVPVRVVLTHKNAEMPGYKKSGDAGADIRSVERAIIEPGYTVMVDVGMKIELPPGWEMQIRSRSGLAKRGLVVANSPGTIDSGYRGPVKVLLLNTGRGGDDEIAHVVEVGDRIAQMVLKRAPQANFMQTNELSDSDRGAGGFGSTGVK